MNRETKGAFDVTTAPLIEARRRPVDRDRRPSLAEFEIARLSSI